MFYSQAKKLLNDVLTGEERMPSLAICGCGYHVSILVAGKQGKQFFATRARAIREVLALKRDGDISHFEEKELTEDIATNPRLHESDEALLNSLEKVGCFPCMAVIVTVGKKSDRDVAPAWKPPFAQA